MGEGSDLEAHTCKVLKRSSSFPIKSSILVKYWAQKGLIRASWVQGPVAHRNGAVWDPGLFGPIRSHPGVQAQARTPFPRTQEYVETAPSGVVGDPGPFGPIWSHPGVKAQARRNGVV